MPAHEFVTRTSDGSYRIVGVAGVCAMHQVGAITPAVVAELEREFRRRVPPGRKSGILLLIDPAAPVPDAATRRALDELYRHIDPQLTAACYVVPLSGFRGAAVRALLTGIQALRRRPYPHRVTATLDEAAAWLCATLPIGAPAGELVAAMQQGWRLAAGE